MSLADAPFSFVGALQVQVDSRQGIRYKELLY